MRKGGLFVRKRLFRSHWSPRAGWNGRARGRRVIRRSTTLLRWRRCRSEVIQDHTRSSKEMDLGPRLQLLLHRPSREDDIEAGYPSSSGSIPMEVEVSDGAQPSMAREVSTKPSYAEVLAKPQILDLRPSSSVTKAVGEAGLEVEAAISHRPSNANYSKV